MSSWVEEGCKNPSGVGVGRKPLGVAAGRNSSAALAVTLEANSCWPREGCRNSSEVLERIGFDTRLAGSAPARNVPWRARIVPWPASKFCLAASNSSLAEDNFCLEANKRPMA